MTPSEIILEASRNMLTTPDGKPEPLKLAPPLSAAEMAEFSAKLPCPLPQEIRELLTLCRGFAGGFTDFVDFTGKNCLFDLTSVFPYGIPIAQDGCGNFWVIDLQPETKIWGPIYFASHDPPVILFQSPTIEHFLSELFKYSSPPHKSLLVDVRDDTLFDVWRKNPSVLMQNECLDSGNKELRSFATELDSSFMVVDLRTPQIGTGFSWGRFGHNTVIRRYKTFPIFAFRKP